MPAPRRGSRNGYRAKPGCCARHPAAGRRGWSLSIALPLWALLSKSFQNANGEFIGLANYIRYFSTPSLFNSIFNSVWVALVTTVIVIPLAFVYAYALTRSQMRFKGLFYAAAMLPLFAPSLLSAISLIYLFGNQGLLKGVMFGGSIYGANGIIIAQVFYCFPHALIIAVTALALADARLYEVADALGTTKSRIFRTVTLAGREVRPDQRSFRGVHAGGDRLRHRQGDRRPVQRACNRCLQAGGRPAEFRDGRGGRHGAARARRARLRHRPHRAAAAGGAAVGARGAARAEGKPRARRRADGLLPDHRGYSGRRARHRDLGLVHHLLAVQSHAHAEELRFRQFRSGRLGPVLHLGRDGGRARRCSAPRSCSPAPTWSRRPR